jgi:hypothetical protein
MLHTFCKKSMKPVFVFAVSGLGALAFSPNAIYFFAPKAPQEQ